MEKMTISETYDNLLDAWKDGIIAFTKESRAAVQNLRMDIPATNIELIDSILKHNKQTALYFKSFIETDVEFKKDADIPKIKESVDRMFSNIVQDEAILTTIRTINDKLIIKEQPVNNNIGDTKMFAIRLSDNKKYAKFHCADLKENGIIPSMALVIGEDRMSLESNIPAIVDHVKQMMIKEGYNTVLFERNDLAIYNELAVEIKNIPELVFVETDIDHR